MMNNEQRVIKVREYLESKNGESDRFGNIKFTGKDGKLWRWKFKVNVVILEYQVVYAASQYTPESKAWRKFKGYSIKEAYENLKQKGII